MAIVGFGDEIPRNALNFFLLSLSSRRGKSRWPATIWGEEAPSLQIPRRLAGPPASVPPDHSDETGLVRAVLAKDRKAAAEFVERYSDFVYAYLYSRLIPRIDLAEDMLQEVFLAAWEGLASFRGASSLKTWLLGIARHKVEGHYRSQLRKMEDLDDQQECPATSSELPLDEAVDRKRLEEKTRRVLAELPEAYSAVLLWRYWEQRHGREIATLCGRTEKAVERLLARAREQFKRRWNDE